MEVRQMWQFGEEKTSSLSRGKMMPRGWGGKVLIHPWGWGWLKVKVVGDNGGALESLAFTDKQH